MKHKITLLTIAAILMYFISCKDDCKPNAIGSPENLDKIDLAALFPYKGDEKLKFLKNGKDTVIFNNLGLTEG
jgi:hypothetical protein